MNRKKLLATGAAGAAALAVPGVAKAAGSTNFRAQLHDSSGAQLWLYNYSASDFGQACVTAANIIDTSAWKNLQGAKLTVVGLS